VSLGDQSVLDTTVNPSISNVTYARPYLVSLPSSFADGKLTLLSPGVAGSGTPNLGNLSPAAGGDNPGATGNPANLSPSAGADNPAKCANSFLDGDWAKPAGEQCK
jgi:hypothetical protein